MKTRAITWLTVVFALAEGATPAAGTVITISFSGVINYVDDGLPIGDVVEVGTPYSGTYSYESSAPDLVPDNTQVGAYLVPGHSMFARIGDLEFVEPGIGIGVYNYSTSDIYTVTSGSTFIAHGIEWESMNVYLVDDTATALASDALPLDAPDLDDFAFVRTFDLLRPFQVGAAISGEITWMARVPEPASFALLAAGSLLCARRRRLR